MHRDSAVAAPLRRAFSPQIIQVLLKALQQISQAMLLCLTEKLTSSAKA
jgi:hypothetical protein